jgi:hypothetical protein
MLFILTAGLLALPANGTAQTAPVIAPEIGQLIAEEGIDAARQRFEELIESPSLNFGVEAQGLMALMGGYMQAGNHEAGEAVAEMSGLLTQKMMSSPSGGLPQGMMEQMQIAEQAEKAQRQAALEEEQRTRNLVEDSSQGNSRNDLERFVGLYADPGGDDMDRAIFVTVSCDGYLVTGPMWADVGPWWMRSAADKVFTYADSWTNLSFEFTGDGGRGMILKHDVEGAPSPLENKAPLPKGWDDCMPRPMR